MTATTSLTAPPLPRRLAAFLYEGVLLFGVLMIAAYLYSALTQQRHALQGKLGLQLFLLVVLAIYFGWFWSHGGQTVAMRAWRIRLVDAQGEAVSEARAVLRFALSWLWFVPALLVAWATGLHESTRGIFGALSVGVAAYALLSLWLPGRQFLHDWLSGTRLIDWQAKRVPASER